MQEKLRTEADGYVTRKHRRQIWKRVVGLLACIVVFCTTYALILPAITMEHTGELTCSQQTLGIHTHSAGCFDDEGKATCGYADFVVHTHDANCYDQDGALVCSFQELKAHTHSEECYAADPVESGEPTLICGQEEMILHEHSTACFDEGGSLICGRTQVLEHIHNQNCFQEVEKSVDSSKQTGLSEEGQAQVDEVVAWIDTLPTSEKVKEKLMTYEDAGNYTDYENYFTIIKEQCITAREKYDNLQDVQKEKVSNVDKLTGLEKLLDERAAYPVLTEDAAFVSELMITETKVMSNATGSSAPMSVCNQDSIAYSFLIGTESYTGACFGQGRVKLEFVLPLPAEQATFDLASMPWMDSSEGYAPSVTTETRVIDEVEMPCQVLTGYKLLPRQDDGGAIPSEFMETVVVSVVSMAPGEKIAIQISAAMEHNTWEGSCPIHMVQERLTIATDTFTVMASLSTEELQAIYQGFLGEVTKQEALSELDGEAVAAAEVLLQQLREAYKQGQLSLESYSELYDRVYSLIYGDVESIAEAAEGTNWICLRDSGWFDAYSNYASSSYSAEADSVGAQDVVSLDTDGNEAYASSSSDVQVREKGGTNVSEDGTVAVSKTISGTDLENVFDITLQVQTSMNVEEIREEPDMAVVIVMDISNTMNSSFGNTTRYAAAMEAAEQFLDQFAANNSLGISKVGYVAFNTDAHSIFDLQPCSTAQQAASLKNMMRTKTGNIVNADGYSQSHSRFTNVEAGLSMAAEMLRGSSNKNKYVIFLSDGFPTTYISSGYSGYDPYDGNRFYDSVLRKPCTYGTSYSDEAAIRARRKATEIKNSGITIFSIGVDVGGQTIQRYITQSENANGFSVVDRRGTTYEIGDANSTQAYQNWLRNSIGSGYYYDSTDSAGLESAYEQIFAEIKHKVEAGSAADWVASDPIPTGDGVIDTVEFICFYNKTPALVSGDLSGEHISGGENTAAFDGTKSAINWDLKKSGYQEKSSGGKTTYTYQLVYRVRLKNESKGFGESVVYPTNDETTLRYRSIQGTDGNLTVSDPKTIQFPIPAVQGYLAELEFQKVDSAGGPLEGAEFTLSHDTEACALCRGNDTSVELANMIAVSDVSGKVSFTNIPSGHKYLLTETKVPAGYSPNGDSYRVNVAYDKIVVTVQTLDGSQKEWQGKVENRVYHELPETGGSGTTLYTWGGLLLCGGAYLLYKHTKRRREGIPS